MTHREKERARKEQGRKKRKGRWKEETIVSDVRHCLEEFPGQETRQRNQFFNLAISLRRVLQRVEGRTRGKACGVV